MFRIDNSSAVATLPAPQAAGTPGYFSRGDVGAGVAPTVLTADWANMVQEELVDVVLAAGLTLDKANHGQLLAALQTLFSPASAYITASSFSASAFYVQWSNGFKIQAQTVTVTTTTSQTFSYPSAFSTASFAWINGDDGDDDVSIFVSSRTATTATVHSTAGSSAVCTLFSMGY